MKCLRKIGCICGICVCLMFVPGCWDYQKINDRASVIGIGVDPIDGQSSLLSYTFQIPAFDQSTAGGGMSQDQQISEGGSSSAQYRDLTVGARGVLDALRQAQLQYPKTFYLSNLQAVVISEKLTAEQIQSVVSELERSPTADKLAFVLFTPESAQKVLSIRGGPAPADVIDRILGSSLKQHAYTTRTRLWEFWRDWKEIGVDPQAPVVQNTSSSLEMQGLFGLHDMTPKIELNSLDTLYFNLVAGSIEQVAVWVQDGIQSFEVARIHSNRNLSASMNNGKVVLHARIRLRGVIVQDETKDTRPLQSADLERYRRAMEQQMQARAVEIVNRLQRHQIDLYGFGRYIFIHNPSTEEFIISKWPETFAHASVDIQVKVTSLQKGTLM